MRACIICDKSATSGRKYKRRGMEKKKGGAGSKVVGKSFRMVLAVAEEAAAAQSTVAAAHAAAASAVATAHAAVLQVGEPERSSSC